MSTVSGLEIANRVETEWRDRLDAAVKAEREHIAQSLEKQADLATDKFERTWAGLTDEEVTEIAFNFDVPSLNWRNHEH